MFIKKKKKKGYINISDLNQYLLLLFFLIEWLNRGYIKSANPDSLSLIKYVKYKC